jgi:hypothetical protein
LENGLSVIEKPAQSKGRDYSDWLGDGKPPSLRDRLEEIIDAALVGCKDFDAFLAAMEAAGVEVKRGKHLAFKATGQERFIRCKSLGPDYTEEAIRERISGKRISAPKAKAFTSPPASAKPNLLLDIQDIMQKARSPGYENWLRVFNLKQSAKTLIYLQERGLDDYALLSKTTEAAYATHQRKVDRLNIIETRLKGISELQRQIGVYSKTKEVYKLYKSLPLKKQADFFEANRADITLHIAAKKHFDTPGLKKFPPMAELKQEYATLAAEKKKLYSGYKESKQEMIDLCTVKHNVQYLLMRSDNNERGRNEQER